MTTDRRKSKAAIRLTSETLKQIAQQQVPAQVVWDSQLTGFGLRTRGRGEPGAWRWIFVYRHRARQTQVTLTLGSPLVHTPEEARRWAKEAAKRANTSDDLFEKKERERAESASERAKPTVKQVWEEWREAEGKAKKSADDDLQRWRDHLDPLFGAMKVADVTPRDVNKIKSRLAEKPATANRCISLLSVIMTFAVAHQYRAGCAPEHPIKGGVVKRNSETPVDFYFTPAQLGRILEASDAEENKAAGLAIRMLALTGARLGEVLHAHWGQFAERADGRLVWTVERTNTKTREPYQRTLDADLSHRLNEWKRLSLADQKIITVGHGEEGSAALRMLFPNSRKTSPTRGTIRLHEAWDRIKSAAGVERGRIHDLRHTVACTIVKETGSLEAAKRQLGHSTILTTQRYVHHMSEMAEATSDLLAKHAEAAVHKARIEDERRKVVPLRGATA